MKEREIAELTDAQLISRFRNGESSAFDRLVDRYQKPLFTYLFRLVGDRQGAEDIFQDTFLKVIKGLQSYKEQNKFRNWLFGIAHHLAIDFLRKEQRDQKIFINRESGQLNEATIGEFVDPAILPDRKIENKELKQILSRAISQLNLEQRQVFLLREHSDMTFKEIAEMLERPLNTALARMRYALSNLRKILNNEYRGELLDVL